MTCLIIGPGDVYCCYMSRLEHITSVLEKSLVDFSARNGQTVQPLRATTSIAKYNGVLMTMPAYSVAEEALVTKLVTVYPKNSKKGLPAIQANVLLFNSESGTLNCIVDGNMLTALRTAHVSAIATKHLASSFEILAVLGTGTQAKSHIQIFSSLFKFTEIRIWGHHYDNAEKLMENLKNKVPNLKVFSSIEEAVKNADVIVTATLSTVPILMASWVKPGAHINAVGACNPSWQELEPEVMQSSTVVVDSEEAALVESGDIILSKAEIHAEIGDVIAKKKSKKPSKNTVFKSLGMAIEDAVTANAVYKSYNDKQGAIN